MIVQGIAPLPRASCHAGQYGGEVHAGVGYTAVVVVVVVPITGASMVDCPGCGYYTV